MNKFKRPPKEQDKKMNSNQLGKNSVKWREWFMKQRERKCCRGTVNTVLKIVIVVGSIKIRH